jgi:predicted porin
MRHVLLGVLALATGAENASAGGPASSHVTATEAAPLVREVAERVDVYGRFDGNLAFDRDGVDLANNGSRFGIAVEQTLVGKIAVFGRGEWAIKLGESDTVYNLSLNPDTDLGGAEATPDQALTTR